MNRKALIAAVVADVASKQGRHVQKTTVGYVIDALFGQIGQALEAGETVHVKGFLTFRSQLRSARNGRHPRTGVPVVYPARRVPQARFHKDFKLSTSAEGA